MARTTKVRTERNAPQTQAKPTTSKDRKHDNGAIGSGNGGKQRKRQIPDALDDAVTGLKRNKALTIWSIVTIALSLFLAGAFVIADIVVGDALDSVENEVTIYAYVDDNASQDDINAYMDTLRQDSKVRDVSFTTKDEAWEDYRKSMGDELASNVQTALDGENPLPGSIVVTMNDANDVEGMAEQIAKSDKFASIADGGTADGNVSYGKQQVSQLLSFTNTMRVVGIVFVIVLIGISSVLVSNTIRNSITVRSEEIGIMRLVGASRKYIRKPFVYEGILQSATGAIIAVIALLVVQLVALPNIQKTISFIHVNIAGWEFALIYALLIAFGIAVGIISTNMSLRKHLTV